MNNQIEIYSSQDGSIQLNVKLENETVWLTQIDRYNEHKDVVRLMGRTIGKQEKGEYSGLYNVICN